jgi:putative hydrolase of the HAD superfamily
MPPIHAILWDFDGLIADTESAVFAAWKSLFAEHDETLEVELWAACVGSDWAGFNPEQELERRLDRSLDWDHWHSWRQGMERQALHDLPPLPGVRDWLAQAASANLPSIVASSSPRSWVEPQLERLKIRHFFSGIRCRDDVARIKPAPDLFLAAAKLANADPARCLIFEDSLNGLHAANAAGIPCIVVPNSVTRHFDFLAEGALAVWDSLASHSLEDLPHCPPPTAHRPQPT